MLIFRRRKPGIAKPDCENPEKPLLGFVESFPLSAHPFRRRQMVCGLIRHNRRSKVDCQWALQPLLLDVLQLDLAVLAVDSRRSCRRVRALLLSQTLAQ